MLGQGWLAPNTISARSMEEAVLRGRALFREWLREIPRAIYKFSLDFSIGVGRSKVRERFERNAEFLDQLRTRGIRESEILHVFNMMNLKGTMQLIEVHNQWAQRVHLMRMIKGEGSPDESWIIPEKLPESLRKEPVSEFLKTFLTSNQ